VSVDGGEYMHNILLESDWLRGTGYGLPHGMGQMIKRQSLLDC
jgi:hypothetical protein